MELADRGMEFASRVELRVFYKERELKKRYVPDLVVCGGIMVELKAVRELTSEHEAQLLNYMRVTKSRVGYLINFGPTTKLEWKRFVI
ncbi:MAG: GxxExxY protein [Verrucomicrobiota bacterium]